MVVHTGTLFPAHESFLTSPSTQSQYPNGLGVGVTATGVGVGYTGVEVGYTGVDDGERGVGVGALRLEDAFGLKEDPGLALPPGVILSVGTGTYVSGFGAL